MVGAASSRVKASAETEDEVAKGREKLEDGDENEESGGDYDNHCPLAAAKKTAKERLKQMMLRTRAMNGKDVQGCDFLFQCYPSDPQCSAVQ